MAEKKGGTSLPTLATELWDLVLTYAKQETVTPVKALGRYVAFGTAGSLVLVVGAALLALAGLRALQTETGTTFQGNLTWAPYGICAGGAVLVVSAAVLAALRGGRSRRNRDRGRS